MNKSTFSLRAFALLLCSLCYPGYSLRAVGIIVSLCYFVSLNSQCPPPGTIFTDQASIDAMSSNYPDCTVLQGNLVIQEATPGAISNLNGMAGLEEISGNLVIRRLRDLQSLAGLNGLKRIGGELNVQANPNLGSLNGLNQLAYVGSQMIIANNASLNSTVGLEGLTTVNGAVYIRSNPTLASIEGFSGLQTIYGDLVINGNPGLGSLAGLENLLRIGRENRAELKITNNPTLRELDGLARLDFSRLSYLEITNCPSLSSGRSNSAAALCQYLNAAGRARIFGNGAGYDSVEVLRAGCR